MELVTHNATSLAWIGDAIFSLRVREKLLEQGYARPSDLEARLAKLASAKGQREILETLQKELELGEMEKEILRRGKSAKVHTKAKNADYETYRIATAYEALLGYLYLYNHLERLEEILEKSLENRL